MEDERETENEKRERDRWGGEARRGLTQLGATREGKGGGERRKRRCHAFPPLDRATSRHRAVDKPPRGLLTCLSPLLALCMTPEPQTSIRLDSNRLDSALHPRYSFVSLILRGVATKLLTVARAGVRWDGVEGGPRGGVGWAG